VVNAAEAVKADVIVEVTGDCPLIDPEVVDCVLEKYLEGNYDYVTNIGYVNGEVREIPIGMDVRVFSYKDLKHISEITDDPEDREHVSLYFFREGKEKYRLYNVPIPLNGKEITTSG
jgi:spore coat polysaccharide biosynthesis protein SpsF